jgi:hypothetical protein
MSPNITKVASDPVEIVPIWSDSDWRISVALHPDGSATLMRSGQADCGGSRSCPIPAGAMIAVGSKLCTLELSRLQNEIAEIIGMVERRTA